MDKLAHETVRRVYLLLVHELSISGGSYPPRPQDAVFRLRAHVVDHE